MPYPHKNDLGKNPPPSPKPPESVDWEKMAEWEKALIEQLENPVKPWAKTQEAMKKLMTEAPLTPHYLGTWPEPKPEPILIPATQSHPYTLTNPLDAPISPGAVIKVMQMSMDVTGLGINKPAFRFVQAIEPYHSYTESEVRAMLFKGFQAYTEEIINQLKGKKP